MDGGLTVSSSWKLASFATAWHRKGAPTYELTGSGFSGSSGWFQLRTIGGPAMVNIRLRIADVPYCPGFTGDQFSRVEPEFDAGPRVSGQPFKCTVALDPELIDEFRDVHLPVHITAFKPDGWLYWHQELGVPLRRGPKLF